MGGGLVEHDDRRLLEQQPGDGEPLLLVARQVERSADPADRRATWVRPTSSGEALLEAVTVQRRAATTSLLDRLSPDERAQLAHLLRVLAEAEPRSTGTV